MTAHCSTTREEPPLLDERTLRILARDIGIDGAIDVVRLFLTEAPRTVERLREAMVNRGPALLREVHTLASAARSVGLLRVGHVAAEMERMIALTESGAERLAELLDLLHRSVPLLAEWEAAQAAMTAAI